MKKFSTLFLSIFLVFTMVGVAAAIPTYVGSYRVTDGPIWYGPTAPGPPVYSAREAAALVFGGVFTDFLISTNAALDYTTITNTGWYAEIGLGPAIFQHDYKLDLGPVGYNTPGWTAGDDVSLGIHK